MGLRGKSTLWLFYTLLVGYFGGQSVPNTVWEAKKKGGGWTLGRFCLFME